MIRADAGQSRMGEIGWPMPVDMDRLDNGNEMRLVDNADLGREDQSPPRPCMRRTKLKARRLWENVECNQLINLRLTFHLAVGWSVWQEVSIRRQARSTKQEARSTRQEAGSSRKYLDREARGKRREGEPC